MRIRHFVLTLVPLVAFLAPLASAAQAPRIGDLVLTDIVLDRVLVVRWDTGAVDEVSPKLNPNLLAAPTGITVAPDGQIYVGDAALDRIVRIDPVTGAQSILRAAPFPIGSGDPVVIPDPLALDHVPGFLGDDNLYVKAGDRLWEAGESLFGGWGVTADLPSQVILEATDVAVDDRDVTKLVIFFAGRPGVSAQFLPDACCVPIYTTILQSIDGQPAFHFSTSVDRSGSKLLVSQVIVRESDWTCLHASGKSRVISIDEGAEIESEGGLLRCPRYVAASREGSRRYVVDYEGFYGGDARIVVLTRNGGGWSQSILAPDLGTTQFGGMAVVVPEAGAAAVGVVAWLGLAMLRRG